MSTQNLTMWLYLEIVFGDLVLQVKVRSYWSRVGPNPITDVLIRKYKHIDIQKEDAILQQSQRLELGYYKPKNSTDHQQPPEIRRGKEDSSPRVFREGMDLQIPWLQISSL